MSQPSTERSSRPYHRTGTRLGVVGAVLALVAGMAVVSGSTSPATAAGPLSVIDDFEDGDTSDWGFFGGNNAGGGGGVATDRPKEGTTYFSTGWGGQGTASGFYGGAFKNYDNAAQVAPPADPWFNVWVLNQSNATADGFTLEITLREDMNGDGWTNGAEDSIRLDTTFTSASFDDEWTLVSAPLSDFINLGTGGDGTFDGDLDEIVIVIAGVTGGDPSTVELDFDQFAFSSGGPLLDGIVFDDMEHGDPLGNGWFSFNGAVGGGGITANNADLPPVDGGAFSLETGWGSGGTAGFFGGFGRTNPTDLSAMEYFSFWINPNAGQDYTLEINLQEDDNGDGAANPADDDEFQYSCVVSPTGPCAVSGGGWQQVIIPLDNFFDDNSFFTGGNGVLDAVPTSGGGNGELVNVVVAVIGNSGSDVNFRTDYWTFLENAVLQPTASFANSNFEIEEGEIATIEVTLNIAPSSTVTVDYATSDGTADGFDYSSTSGTLTFAPGDQSETFTITTTEDGDAEPNEIVNLVLTNPSGADLGPDATLTIVNDDIGDVAPTFDRRSIVDDFESGLPEGTDDDGNPVGFDLFRDDASSVAITTAAPPSAVPGEEADNDVLQLDLDTAAFAGTVHLLENAGADEWVPQDWSRYEGISFWFYGNNSGTSMFMDILDNRNSGSTTDDAERFVADFTDDTLGWKYVKIPFADFTRKEIGNGAPNDGLGLNEMHGWAIGSLITAGALTFFVDDVAIYQRETIVEDFESGLPAGTDGDGNPIGFVTFSDGSPIAISTTTTADAGIVARPPAPPTNSVLEMTSTVNGFAGFTHAFENGAVDTWEPQDWGSYEGVSFWLHGTGTGVDLFFDIIENRNPGFTNDTAERWTYEFTDDVAGWQRIDLAWDQFSRKGFQVPNAPDDGFTRDEVHGYAFGSLASDGAQTQYLDDIAIYGNNLSDIPLEVRFTANRFPVDEGADGAVTVKLNRTSEAPVTVDYATSPSGDRQETEDLIATPDRDYVQTAGTLTFAPGETEQTFNVSTLDDDKWETVETALLVLSDPVGADLASLLTRASLQITDDDPRDPMLIDDFETFPYEFETDGAVSLGTTEITDTSPMALPGQTAWENVLTTSGTGSFTREFEQPVDWSAEDGVSVWVYGTDSGEEVSVELLDNRLPDPGPSGWELAWSDEFNAPAGTPADPANWTYETGGWGWGNDELQYYTDSTDNAAHDGLGHMVITVEEVEDPAAAALPCWYGDCTHTSARLITEQKQEFAYGRIEARAKVPGGTGIWPAIWSLGDDFRDVRWPQTGEIDVMEFVGRQPNRVFGTIHGPGYSGGSAWFGDIDIGEPVPNEYHTYVVEWQPGHIVWTIDGVQYHSAMPEDVAPNEWVFEHPFFLLLNVAVGGNFGGPLGPDLTFPAELLVDYIRVYQAPDTSERFEASFTDDFTGWQQVEIPWSAFTRSADQPAGAPDDGLTLTEVWGYGLGVTTDGPNTFDQVRVDDDIATPLSLKTEALDDIRALLPSGDPRVDALLARAIDKIDASLDDRYWESDTRLDERLGSQVFRLERQAVRDLLKAADRDPALAGDVAAVIDVLIATDAELAQAEIAAATAAEGNVFFIGIAERLTAAAERQIDRGNYSVAIWMYGLTWRFASLAY